MVTEVAQKVERRRFTAEEYHKLAEVGILHEDDRVELIDGEIIQMSAVGSIHFGCVSRLDTMLHEALGRTAVIAVQSPFHTDEYGEPEPDILVLKPQADFYSRSLPTPSDVLLVIEVADTSLAYDRNTKLPMYARVGIPETILVDLNGKSVERHTDPENGIYRSIRIARQGDRIESTAIPGLSLDVAEILG